MGIVIVRVGNTLQAGHTASPREDGKHCLQAGRLALKVIECGTSYE